MPDGSAEAEVGGSAEAGTIWGATKGDAGPVSASRRAKRSALFEVGQIVHLNHANRLLILRWRGRRHIGFYAPKPQRIPLPAIGLRPRPHRGATPRARARDQARHPGSVGLHNG